MVATKLVKSRLEVAGTILGVESQALSTTAEDLDTIGYTIPAGTTEIIMYGGAVAAHWHPTGTPTTTFGHVLGIAKFDSVPAHHMNTFKIRSASGTPDLICIYMGG